MDRCLLDTSALSEVIDVLAMRSPLLARRSKAYLRAHGHFTFSEVTCYEILRGLRKKHAVVQEQRFRAFCDRCERIPVTAEVFDLAATLWATGQAQGMVIEDADLIIAATAMIERLTLVTANLKHFAWMDGITLLNWRDPA